MSAPLPLPTPYIQCRGAVLARTVAHHSPPHSPLPRLFTKDEPGVEGGYRLPPSPICGLMERGEAKHGAESPPSLHFPLKRNIGLSLTKPSGSEEA